MISTGLRLAAVLLLLFTLAILRSAPVVTPQGARQARTGLDNAVKDALPRLDKLAEQTLKKTGVPGLAVAVAYKDEVVHLKGFGVRQAGKKERVDADTVFQLASVSKPLSATVLAALVGEGVIGWDDRVSDRDPTFCLSEPWPGREVTIRDLLCHRSGLPDHEGDLLEDLDYGRAEVLRRLRFVKLQGFRSHYAYTNFGFTEAAVAGARAAGKDWEDVAAEKLFRPLGMKSSSYRHADYAAAANRARLHVQEGDRWVARHDRQPDAQSPAGGASSSARDMAQWLRLLLGDGKVGGKQVVAAKALAETHRPQIVSHQPANASADRAGLYALGWNVNYDDNRVRLSHSGGFALGAATVVTLLPGEGLGIVVLTNGAPIGVPEAISASFFDLVLKGKANTDYLARYKPFFDAMAKPAYGGAIDFAKPPARPSPPMPAEAYLGRYHNDYFGTIEVVAKGKGLALRMGPKKAEFALRHWDRDVYTYQPTGENAGGPSGVTFWVGPGGKAGRIVVENLDVQGRGTFVRASPKK